LKVSIYSFTNYFYLEKKKEEISENFNISENNNNLVLNLPR
jgi:hypothetical protein